MLKRLTVKGSKDEVSEKLKTKNEKLWIQKIHIYDFVVFTVETSIAINSFEVKQQSSELIKSMPQRMESQGLRDVKIMTTRGGPVVVGFAYAKKSAVQKQRKGGIAIQRNGGSQNFLSFIQSTKRVKRTPAFYRLLKGA